MPLHDYLCMDCGETGHRVAGTDDHVAICVNCRGVILRVDMDIWAPLWGEQWQLQGEGQ